MSTHFLMEGADTSSYREKDYKRRVEELLLQSSQARFEEVGASTQGPLPTAGALQGQGCWEAARLNGSNCHSPLVKG